ncbi:MAG: DUF1273 family protein [Clostridia bacterium]|nr:DUF1273 family protein [Clostridia bacterium]
MMENIIIDREKAVAFTGHRQLPINFNKKNLEKKIEDYILSGKEIFLIGMAVGFDTLCFQMVEKLKKTYKNIKIIACVPCENQQKSFSFLQKLEYARMLRQADQVIMVSKEYTPYCMQKRNMFMVDNASILLAHLTKKTGGTANTVTYAKKCGISIEFI